MPNSINDPRRSAAASAPAQAGGYTCDQLVRLARLIADGACEPPDDLTTAELQQLAPRVRDRLRERLLDMSARSIAGQLTRAAARDA